MDTQVRMPPGMMLAGESYVLSISASQNGVLTPTEPYRDSLPSAYAAVTSGIIQMAP
jgi:hypothetical protein